MRPEITRATPLLDYEVRREGDGRTVAAYAATFGTEYEVRDEHGHYDEAINRSAFNKVLARPGAIEAVRVLVNHGMTVWGTPSERFSSPVGTPIEIKPDGRGLLTVTRYAKTELGDEYLELWRSGGVRSQSFRGTVYDSAPARIARSGRRLIERMSLGLKEYGPATFATNADAGLVAIRSQLASLGLTDDQLAALRALLIEAPSIDPASTDDPHEVPDVDPAPDAPDATGTPVDSPDPGLPLDVLALANANRRRRSP